MPNVPTSDLGDEVGGVLDDGTVFGEGMTYATSSERIRAEAQRRAALQAWDDDIVSPDSLRLKVLDDDSDDDEVELASPSRRPRRAAVRNVSGYKDKLSLSRPSGARQQQQRGVPKPMTTPGPARAPRTIAAMLRQKHAQHRKGLDDEGLRWADQVAAEPIKEEIAMAQRRMNAEHVEPGSVELALGSGKQSDQLLRLLQRDSAENEKETRAHCAPLLWTAPRRTYLDARRPGAMRRLYALEGDGMAQHMQAHVERTPPSLAVDLVAWLVHWILAGDTDVAEAARTSLLSVASRPRVQDAFWASIKRAMLCLGADPLLLAHDDDDELGPAPAARAAKEEGIARLWRTVIAMPPLSVSSSGRKDKDTLFSYLVLYAATQPPSCAADAFLSRVPVGSGAVDALCAIGTRLGRAHQRQLVAALPGAGDVRRCRAALAFRLLCTPTSIPPVLELTALCTTLADAPERRYEELRATLDILSYALDIAPALEQGDLEPYSMLLPALAALDQSIHDHRGSFTERSACKDMLQRLQLRVRYQIQAYVEHAPQLRASWTMLLSG